VKAPYSRTLFELLREQAERAPDAPAALTVSSSVTYAQLLDGARRIAAGLRRRGVGHGDRVAALVCNRVEWLELAFAASAVGAVFVPVSTWSTRHELEFLLSDCAAKILVAHARYGERDFDADLAALAPEIADGRRTRRFPTLEGIFLMDRVEGDAFADYASLRAAGSWEDLAPGEAAGAGDDAFILYTSGSSALPKAVRLRQGGTIENGFNIGERMALGRDDRVFLSAPLFWSYGSANAMCATFTHGAALVLQERFEPGGAMDLIERFGCTAIYTLPGMTKAISAHPGYRADRLRSLRTGLTIGAPQEFLFAVTTLGAKELCNIYGATETYGNCCVTDSRWPLERRAQCQGEPLPGNVLRIVEAEGGGAVARGEPGLVEVRGYVTPGYDGASSAQNRMAFTADGFYRTGDVGRLDAEGAFVFIGRNAEMIKRAGINVSPAEVENALLQHPGVAQVAVVGAPDDDRGEIIVAFVVAGAQLPGAEDLVAHCRSLLSKYKAPDLINFRSDLPLTTTGKLQRRALKTLAADLAAGGRSNG